MDSLVTYQHSILLKVMQLTQLSTAAPQIITCEDKDFPGNCINEYLTNDVKTVEDTESLAAGQFLVAPQIMEVIYVGETLSCYVYIYNDSSSTVKNVSTKVTLDANDRPLYKHMESDCVLGPSESLSHVIHHPVATAHPHLLTCEIEYFDNLSGRKITYKKKYQFFISEMFDIRTNIFHTPFDTVLQIQLANKSNDLVWLDKLFLRALQGYNITCLNPVTKNLNISPRNALQFLFSLTTAPGVIPNFNKFPDHGYFDFIWRSRSACKGQSQTVEFKINDVNSGDLKVSIKLLSLDIKLEQHFEFVCSVMNTSEKDLDLILKLRCDETSGLLWSGVSNRKIDKLESGAVIELSLCAFPINVGFQKIKGISFTDVFLNRTYDYDDLATVFVS